MPIEIRSFQPADVPALMAIEHDYVSEYVWQMDVAQAEDGQITVTFRPVRLPRSVKVDYPRSRSRLAEERDPYSCMLVAEYEQEVVGYINMLTNISPMTTWVTDLAVMRRFRRQGIGSALVLAAQSWARSQGSYRITLEMQPKNHPAISLAQKLGFYFCGYNDRYFANHDIALFFAKSVR